MGLEIPEGSRDSFSDVIIGISRAIEGLIKGECSKSFIGNRLRQY